MCYNYEDLEHRARKSWKHQHGEETVTAGDQAKPAVIDLSGEEKDSSVYPMRKGRIILLGETEVREGYFGLLSRWNKKFTDVQQYNTFNARADSIMAKRTWREPWSAKQRCIIETTGFYEKNKRTKRKYFFSVSGSEYFYYGGLFNWWTNPENGDKILTYAIITTDPNDLVIDYHQRMPWIVEQDDRLNYMDPKANPEDLLNMMKPYPAFLMNCMEVEEPPRKKKDNGQTSLGL